MAQISSDFRQWLSGGGRRIGEILLTPMGAGWELRHAADEGSGGLELGRGVADARRLANLADRGEYRPLKTAPTLRRGWSLACDDAADLQRVLEAFYPAMIGMWSAWKRGDVAAVPLRTTLERQTGMYRVTRNVTDEQADEVIGKTCPQEGGCLKTILWKITPERAVRSLPENKFAPPSSDRLPLICHEACNFLVAAMRKKVKGESE